MTINTLIKSTISTTILTTIKIIIVEIEIRHLNQLKQAVNTVRLLNGIMYRIIIIEDLIKLKMVKDNLKQIVSTTTM